MSMMSMNSTPLPFYLTSLSQNKLKEAHERARARGKGRDGRIIDIIDIIDIVNGQVQPELVRLEAFESCVR
jgi:hypothetical protein